MAIEETQAGTCCGKEKAESLGCGGCGSNGGGCCGSSGGGGCGSSGGGCCGSGTQQEQTLYLSWEEEAFLEQLAQCPFLPIAEFLLASQNQGSSLSISPVFLETGTETLEQIKHTAGIILDLEEKEILSLDYEEALSGMDESLFRQSQAFRLLTLTVEQGKDQAEFHYHPPEIRFGSLSLSPLGRQVIEQLDYL